MRLDVILEANNSAARVAELTALAEEYGLGGVWVSNMHDARDPFINFVEAARVTERICLGPVAVSPYELHPLKMATALLTLNEISAGRAHLGVAAGGGGAPTAMGVPQERRVRAVRECVEILRAATTGEPLQYRGEMFKVHYYHPSWVSDKPPRIYVCANGPQMLRSSAKYADGIFVGDHLPENIKAVRETIDAQLEAAGRSKKDFHLNNFWAWHVKESREDAEKEARQWLAVRATPYKEFYHRDILADEEIQIVWDNISSFIEAFNNKSDVIEGVPEEIVTKLVQRTTSASSIDELDKEIDRFRQFKQAGLTELALRLYDNPEASIRLIGERVLPAL